VVIHHVCPAAFLSRHLIEDLRQLFVARFFCIPGVDRINFCTLQGVVRRAGQVMGYVRRAGLSFHIDFLLSQVILAC
jgi:hypothetical protein